MAEVRITDTCRYCGTSTTDPSALGPDDVAPHVCPCCIDRCLGEVTMIALVSLMAGEDPVTIKAQMRAGLIEFGILPVWADRFINSDLPAFEQARERLSGSGG